MNGISALSQRQRRGLIPAWANGPGHDPTSAKGLKARPLRWHRRRWVGRWRARGGWNGLSAPAILARIFHEFRRPEGVAQTSSLLYRGFPIRRCDQAGTACRLEVGDTAGWKPALRSLGSPVPPLGCEVSGLARPCPGTLPQAGMSRGVGARLQRPSMPHVNGYSCSDCSWPCLQLPTP
jgi:hypothetical protein